MRLPSGCEHFDLWGRPAHARQVHLCVDRRGQCAKSIRRDRSGDHEVVGRRLQSRSHHLPVVLDHPQPVFGIDIRLIPERACDPEHEIVARLVLEQQGAREVEKLGSAGKALDDDQLIV